MSDAFFIRKGNKFLGADDQFSLPTIYGFRDKHAPAVEFVSEDAAVAKALVLGVPLDRIKVVCTPKREAD